MLKIDSTATLFSSRFLNNNQNQLQQAMERLSSAKRINRASDDAAGLAIAAQLTTQLLGSQQAYKNTNDAISLAQTGDAAITELSNISQRIGELAVQSANGIYSDADRESLQAEVSQLQQEAQNIVESAEFNGQKLLSGGENIEIQAGNDAGNTISINTANLQAELTTAGLFSVDVSTSNDAQNALGAIEASLDSIVKSRSEFGAFTNRLESVSRQLLVEAESTAAARSRIEDADYAVETAERTRSLILQDAGLASIAQGNISNGLVTRLLGA